MTIQQMMLGGKSTPTFVSSNSVIADATSRIHVVPVNTQEGDLLIFFGSYEKASNRYWTGNNDFTFLLDASRIWGEPDVGGSGDGTTGLTAWYKVASASDTPGKQYTFSLNASRKSKSDLISVRNSFLPISNSTIYRNTSAASPVTLDNGPIITSVPVMSIVYFVHESSNETWGTVSDSFGNYTTINMFSSSVSPTTSLSYKEDNFNNPIPNVTATHTGGGASDVEAVYVIVS